MKCAGMVSFGLNSNEVVDAAQLKGRRNAVIALRSGVMVGAGGLNARFGYAE